jgi:Winged helix DNA-binding domain
MTIGLTLRGCYLGSNVSYNVRKLVEKGYLIQERSAHDRRSFHVRLTDKGRDCAIGAPAPRRHADPDRDHGSGLQSATVTLRRLEQFWIRASDTL